MTDAPDFLRAGGIARLTGVSVRTVRRWIADDTLPDVVGLLDQAGLAGTRRRDMVSAVKRVCEMAGTTPASVRAEPSVLKDMLSQIRPAAHGVSAKSYSNLKTLLGAALQLAG